MLGHGSGVYPVERAALDIRPVARGLGKLPASKKRALFLASGLRSEQTAHRAPRPVNCFELTLRPAMVALNAMGNAVVQRVGIVPAGDRYLVQSADEPPIETGAYNAACTATVAIEVMFALLGDLAIPLVVLPR
jgi:hypothetical protein